MISRFYIAILLFLMVSCSGPNEERELRIKLESNIKWIYSDSGLKYAIIQIEGRRFVLTRDHFGDKHLAGPLHEEIK